MSYREEQLKKLDTTIEWSQFLIAAARSPIWAAIPYLRTMVAAMRRQVLVGRILLEGEEKALSNETMARRVVHAVGFERPWDALRWIESGRSVYSAWQKAKAAGDFSLMVKAADKRYALAREIGSRRMAEFNALASRHGWQMISKISESFVQRQTPGLNTFKVDCMSDDAAFWAPLVHHSLKEWQVRRMDVPRKALLSINAEDKMRLARRLLDKDPDRLFDVRLKAVENPLCQGYGDRVGIGLNPDVPLFQFLKAYRHERAHAAYRTKLKGAPPSAALDELLPLMDEHFILPTPAECQTILDELKWVMGEERFPDELTAEHIKQGLSSVQSEDMGGEPDLYLYAINRAIYSRSEAKMLDEVIPMEQFPDVLAEHVWMFTGKTISRAEAEKMALARFQ
ncbi:MAG: hypothetical protein LRY54_03920, partial [Alphaproteobacteria bacterium]|nr:hypothetical protein [Alphaproteobacteria bacterium]